MSNIEYAVEQLGKAQALVFDKIGQARSGFSLDVFLHQPVEGGLFGRRRS